MTASEQENGREFREPRRWVVWSGAAALMVLPVLALRDFSDPASDPEDFMFLVILLSGVALAYELGARTPDRRAYFAGVCMALAASLGSIWINLAVGIIGSEDNPANYIYAGVTAVAFAFASIGRFEPVGMARAMVAAAIAQVLVFVFALVGGLGFTGPITVFFTALWLIAGWLFRKAASEQAQPAAVH
jgi:hypothetical protein